MKTTISSVLGGIAFGYFLYKALQAGLKAKRESNEDSAEHTFAINELTAPGSIDLNELKEKIRNGS